MKIPFKHSPPPCSVAKFVTNIVDLHPFNPMRVLQCRDGAKKCHFYCWHIRGLAENRWRWQLAYLSIPSITQLLLPRIIQLKSFAPFRSRLICVVKSLSPRHRPGRLMNYGKRARERERSAEWLMWSAMRILFCIISPSTSLAGLKVLLCAECHFRVLPGGEVYDVGKKLFFLHKLLKSQKNRKWRLTSLANAHISMEQTRVDSSACSSVNSLCVPFRSVLCASFSSHPTVFWVKWMLVRDLEWQVNDDGPEKRRSPMSEQKCQFCPTAKLPRCVRHKKLFDERRADGKMNFFSLFV